MKNNEKLVLIEGEFQHQDAKEILRNVFSTKINFHQLKNFRSKETFGKVDETAMTRIPALKKEIVKLEQILLEAEEQNKKLIISSEINIQFSNE